jgi:hypothetical protein
LIPFLSLDLDESSIQLLPIRVDDRPFQATIYLLNAAVIAIISKNIQIFIVFLRTVLPLFVGQRRCSMIKGNVSDFEDWLDGVRVQMYEDMQCLGQAEYDKRMDASVKEAAKKYGITLIDSVASRPNIHTEENVISVQAD